MELVRRHTGRYELPLPYFLPTGYGHMKLINAMSRECLDCRNSPPASWSVEQVAAQVAISGLQGRPQARARVWHLVWAVPSRELLICVHVPFLLLLVQLNARSLSPGPPQGAAVSARFFAARIDGAALLRLNRSALLSGLRIAEDEVEALEPWVRRIRSDNAKVWAFGVHCCARWLSNMPTRTDWIQVRSVMRDVRGVALHFGGMCQLPPYPHQLHCSVAFIQYHNNVSVPRVCTPPVHFAHFAQALTLPTLGPLRPKEASVHRIGWKGRRFLEAFKAFHQVCRVHAAAQELWSRHAGYMCGLRE